MSQPSSPFYTSDQSYLLFRTQQGSTSARHAFCIAWQAISLIADSQAVVARLKTSSLAQELTLNACIQGLVSHHMPFACSALMYFALSCWGRHIFSFCLTPFTAPRSCKQAICVIESRSCRTQCPPAVNPLPGRIRLHESSLARPGTTP